MSVTLSPIHDQVVAVVGATSGIGRETSRQFAARGARLVVAARDEAALEELAGELRGLGAPAVEIVAGDVVDPAAMRAVADRAIDRFGRLDTWAHIAGVDVFATFEDTTPDEFRRVVEVNLIGAANGAFAALPILRRDGGAFIAVSSVEADVPLPLQSAYAASKHGLGAMLRTIRMELGREDGRVAITQIQPYGIDTPLFRFSRTRLSTGVRPPAPTYDPAVVAELIVHAAEHPSRELFAGGAAWLSAMAQRYAPRLNEAVMARVAVAMQRSPDDPVPARDSLFRPVPGDDAVRGGFGGRSFSLANKVQMIPASARLAAFGLIGGLAAVALWRRAD